MAWLWTNVDDTSPAESGRRIIHVRASDYEPGRRENEQIDALIEIDWPHRLADTAARLDALKRMRELVEAEIRRLRGQ